MSTRGRAGPTPSRCALFGAAAIALACAAQGAALPRTLEALERGEDVTILVTGDSLVAGLRSSADGATFTDAEGQASSWVGGLASRLARRYPKARVVLVYRGPEIAADGASTCEVSAVGQRMIQGGGSTRQTITVIRDGVGGNNVWRLLARFDPDPVQRFPAAERKPETWRPTAVIVAIGVNDSLGDSHPLACYPTRHVVTGAGTIDLQRRGESKPRFVEGLAAVRRRLATMEPTPEIAFATPPGADVVADTSGYADALRAFAGTAHVGVIDLAGAARARGALDPCERHPWYAGTDCLHPNDRGYADLAEAAFAHAFGR